MIKYVVHNEDNPLTKENILEFMKITKDDLLPEEELSEKWITVPRDWVTMFPELM